MFQRRSNTHGMMAVSLAFLFLCIQGTFAQDAMSIDGPESTYTIRLDGQDCLQFNVPKLEGCGDPSVAVSDNRRWLAAGSHDLERAGRVAQDELAIQFDLAIDPDFWWAPHLAPAEGYVLASTSFAPRR